MIKRVRRQLHGRNDVGFWGGIFGIGALVLGWIPLLGAALADILGILAILFGLVGMSQSGPKRFAMLGVVLGVVMLVLKHLPVLSAI